MIEERDRPLHSTYLSFLTKKTVILLLLTAGLGRNELHALDVDKTLYGKDNKLLLLHKDEFMAKNMNTKTGKGKFKGIELESLTDFTGPNLDKDGLLCPVK